jgi:hypothetical protein
MVPKKSQKTDQIGPNLVEAYIEKGRIKLEIKISRILKSLKRQQFF